MKRVATTVAVIGLALMLSIPFLTSVPSAREGESDRPFLCLTEEQREAVHSRIEKMREEDADPEEIHDAVSEMLKGYGVDVPGHQGRGPARGLLSGLSDEQRDAVKERIREMRKAGVDREEIHTEVAGMLKGYGVNVPDIPPGPRGHRAVLSRLSEEQRLSMEEKIKDMHDAGKSREEIHAKVPQMLKEYGIEVPDTPQRRERRFANMRKLSDEQRKAVREKMRTMRDAKASREEIGAAVTEMLREYGVETQAGTGQMLGRRNSLAPRLEAETRPNPANSEVNITYILPARSDVRIRIYNTSGQLVRSYDMGEEERGSHSVRWDGKYENGKTAPSGMYLYRIEAGELAVTNCMALLK